MTPTQRKHFGESWVVTANRERDRQADIESRERIEAEREKLLDEYQAYELTADLPILDLDSVVKVSEKGIDNREPS